MANEILKFLNGQSSNLASKTVQAGQVYFAINSDGETGSIYFDAPISSTVTKRIAMSGQSVEHANEADYATRDALGNIITDTYISQMRLDNSGTKIQYKYPGTQTWSELQPLFLPLAGGQITNDLGVNGTITAGNLIVNGAARFAQTILGNILSADKWSTARNFSISDATAAHTGTTVAVDGSAAVTLPLPATITATLKGNADTATTSTNATNLQAYNTNEVTIGANSTTAGASTNDTVWINYKDRSNGATNNNATKITHYYFGNRKGATTGVTVHADTFAGNASSADIWKTGRKFYISDSDASNTGTAVTVNGSQDYTLPLPATIKATLKGNADTATKATQDANGKVISTEYLHRVANSSSTLNQFSGAPAYLLGIESFANGGEVKWQAIADISVGNATTANTWKTARNFSISDDSAKNTGTTVSVNGGDNVVLPLPNQIYLTGNHAGFINGGETDKFFDFAYGANPTTSSGASWRIGALNSGSGDTNYFVIQTGGSTTSNTTWNNALRIGMNTLDIYVGGNLNPLVTNTKTLGTSDYKWKNVYATAFTGNLTGNADSATKWKDARKFSISDSDASHTGTQVSIDGSQDYVLPLPSTIKGTLEGNATTSTTASKLAVGASITTAANLDAFLEASKLKATLISTGVTYADGTLSGNDGEVISIGYSNTTYGNQIFFDPDTDKISVRRKSTSWKPWVDLIHTGNISSYSAGSSSKWATARKFSISDSDASNTGTQISVDGSKDYVLPLPATIKATLKGNADTATNAAYQHYYYHDLFAFCRIGTPTLETTTDGTTWIAATLDKNIFDQKNLTSMTLFNNNIIGYRWIWHSNNFSYSGGVFILTSWSYTSPSSTQSVTLETSTDGTAWTSRGTMTGNWSSSNGTLQVDNYGSDTWIKVTILRTSTSGTTRLANLRLLSARPGDQGQGKEYEYPYTWDANSNIFPVVNNTQDLGSSSLKWAHIYGDLVGNADSATKWKNARNFAVADNDASHTGEAVSVNGTDNVTLKLPSTIKASLAGNATTATTATNTTNLLAYAGNEVTIGANSATAGASTNSAVYINYRDISSGAKDNNATQITDYYFCNRKGGTTGVTVRAETFSGNATSADKWKTGRKFSISDHDASNTGTQVTVNGTADYVLPLPATIKGTLKGNADSATVSRYISCPDTRSAVIKPEDLTAAQGVQFNFKQKSVTGLTAAYAGVMSFRPYSSASDWSGGPAHEVAFDNNGIYHRKSTDSTTWGAWETIIHSGNINTYASGSADKWTTPRNFYIADADAANTGDAVSVDGSANVTLKLPSTIKATLTGNASSATKAYVTIADTTKFYLIGSTNTSSGNADLKEDTGLYAGTTKGQLGAAYVGINGDNTSYRLYVNGTSLFTGLVNINTSTGTLKIGSQNSSWTHFEAQRDFYFNRQASINGNFLPYTDLTYNLGADSYRWSNVYANVLRLQGAASDPSTSAGARIEFTYDNGTSRSQGVYISYSPNDSYRAPGGLKVMGASDLGGSAWFEVEGATYSNGIIYAKATTDSSSTSTGALVVTGGVGIAKQLRVGDNTNIAGTLGVTKATTLSSTLTVSGNTSLNGNLTVASNKTTALGGTLTVSGIATFSNQIKVEKDTDSTRSLDGNASIVTDGGISVAKQLSAKMIKIDNGQTSEGCQLKYNETNNCLEFIFS